MPDKIFLGSEVIIISVDDARRLIKALLRLKPSKMKELQQLGILDILMALDSTVKRYDYEVEDA